MNLNKIGDYFKKITCVLFVVALLTELYQYEENKWKGELNLYKARAQEQLTKETAAILERERQLHERIYDLELEYYEKEKTISDLNDRNLELIKFAGGLRDEGGSSSSGSTQAKNNSTRGSNEARTGYVLSDKTTQFLLDLTTDADRIANQLRLCQNFIRELMQE